MAYQYQPGCPGPGDLYDHETYLQEMAHPEPTCRMCGGDYQTCAGYRGDAPCEHVCSRCEQAFWHLRPRYEPRPGEEDSADPICEECMRELAAEEACDAIEEEVVS